MKYRKIIRNILRALLFLLVLHVSARYLGHVLYPREGVARVLPGDDRLCEDYSAFYFGKEEQASVDTVFIGSSHQFCSVDVNILNHEYGMNSILLATRSQNLKLSYYAIQEAIELQHPKTVVLETCAAVTCEEEPDTLAKTCFFDYMPNRSKTKWKAIQATGDPPYLYYYPITALHGNWGDVRLQDLKLPRRLEPGERYCYTYLITTPLPEWKIVSPDIKSELREDAVRWLEKITELCLSNDMELILYTAPYPADEEEQAQYNAIADFAEEKGLRYYNLMHEMDAIGLDPDCDFMDIGHLNRSGQQKLTHYLGRQHLVEGQ